MTNNIVAIQGNHPSELNPKSDTSAFLAVEAQNRKFKIFKSLALNDNNVSLINNTNLEIKNLFADLGIFLIEK